MERYIHSFAELAIYAWHNAGPAQYAQIALAVIVLGWFVGKYFS